MLHWLSKYEVVFVQDCEHKDADWKEQTQQRTQQRIDTIDSNPTIDMNAVDLKHASTATCVPKLYKLIHEEL